MKIDYITEMLLNFKEQGFMKDLDYYEKQIMKTTGIVKELHIMGWRIYANEVIDGLYIPIIKFFIKKEGLEDKWK